MRLADHLDVTDHLLATTPAVRRKLDLDRPVPDEVLLECLRLAVQAPTPGAVQAWRWLVVRDQERRAAIGALFRQVGEPYMAARAATATPGALASGRHLVDVIERVPVLVIPCVQGRPPAGNAAQSVFYGGIFPAVWNFEHEEEAAQILGIPDDVTQVGLLPVAYATVADFRPPPRQPVEELSYLDEWGAPLT
jgi:nitroreductase